MADCEDELEYALSADMMLTVDLELVTAIIVEMNVDALDTGMDQLTVTIVNPDGEVKVVVGLVLLKHTCAVARRGAEDY